MTANAPSNRVLRTVGIQYSYQLFTLGQTSEGQCPVSAATLLQRLPELSVTPSMLHGSRSATLSSALSGVTLNSFVSFSLSLSLSER